MNNTIRPYKESVCSGFEQIMIWCVSDGVLSRSKAAELLEMSLSDFQIIYGDKINKEIEYILENEKE